MSVETLTPRRYDPKLAAPFIYKSLSAETRSAYARGLAEFFASVGQLHPADVTPAHVIAYRDGLVERRLKDATVATRLAVVRSFFSYLQAAGMVALNPASTKLVAPPPRSHGGAGRALSPTLALHLLAGPDQSTPEGARDYALLLVMLRLALRVAEVVSLRRTSMRWDGERWVLRCRVKGGREEVWPLPKEVKEAIDHYLRLDRGRREIRRSGGEQAPLFQPHTNYRTLVFDRALSRRHVERIVKRWGDFTGVGKVTPHDLRRTLLTELLKTYSLQDVQKVSKHRDVRTLMVYDKERDNLDRNPVNTFSYDPK